MTNDTPYWLALNKINNIGSAKIKKLCNYFPTMKDAWEADINEWKKSGLNDETVTEFYLNKNQINPEQLYEEMEKENVKIITILDDDYPSLLKEIYTPPAILYCRGTLPHPADFCLSVVGTRKISTYGKQVAADLVAKLVQNQITIISGLAIGIDGLSHQTTLENNGKTVAVLGGGIDKATLYPAANRYLADQIVANGGAIISEYPIKTMPTRFNFPARNRIIAGLSLGTLIIEADENSGSLITAKFALEQNREVFAVPGNIYSNSSKGTHKILKQGAQLVTDAQDILETLNLEQIEQFVATKKISPDTKEEEVLLNILSKEPIHIDILVKQSQLNTSIVGATLTMMEMKGKVKNLGGMNYVLAR